ncbi:hypothetical protein ES703_69951 [subsurface metagenome]
MQDTRNKMRVTSHEPRATNKGLTLMEMTVVIAVMALLAVFGLPAIRALINSFESEGGAKAMISAGLASARAIAAKEHHYAGVRFQHAYDPQGLLNAPQYMVFIVHDFGATGLEPGFRAVEGINPIRLPGSVGVMDLRTGSTEINSNNDINEERELMDTTTFSVVFSPSGKLIIHDVRVRNRDGHYRPINPDDSMDDIFNSPVNIDIHNTGMFVQDDYAHLGLGEEPSRNRFIIYDKSEFNKVDESKRYSDYLRYLEPIYINPYTGTMIKK